MASPTFIRTPQGAFFAQGQNGLVAITDPVQLHDLMTGATPSVAQDPMGSTFANVASPTTPAYAGPQAPTAPQPAPATPAPAAATGKNPYDMFNTNIASILQQIQQASTTGRANLGAAADALTTEGVGAAGSYNPNATPGVNEQNQTGTLGAFAPAVTSVNTQLANADTGIKDLEGTIGTIAQENLPQKVSPGESLVTPGGTTITQGHEYTPTMNPQTGLIDGFDVNTGTWASSDGAGSTGNGGGANAGIEAIFGASNPIGAYATDPNYTKEISGLYQTVASSGVTQSPEALQSYIDNNAKGSPVTAQMILNAAQTYGIDPALLTTVLLHESDFGTAGAAVKTMNPGNQGNTGTSTQSFNSWQQGVMATAKNLSNRIAQAGSPQVASAVPTAVAPASSDTSAVGGTFSPDAAQKVSQLPASMQTYASAGPLGVAYINDDIVPDQMKQSVQTLAARAGIPYVQASDVGALKSIGTVLDNLDSMQTLAQNTLSSGGVTGSVGGHVLDSTLGKLNEISQSKWGQQLGLFDNYRDTAIKAVQALAGGAGSGLRINMGEISANVQNLPQATDSQQNAILQIKNLRQLIYTQLSQTFPYAPIQVANPSGQVGSIPAGQLSGALKSGYTVI